ncbi:MAG: ATPase, T2SS/T4P/T4SS family [Burkholderiaceae bacterium]
MLTLSIDTEAGVATVHAIDEFPCRIGRHRAHPLVLPSWRVARTHAEIRRTGERCSIVDLGSLGGTTVNGERINEYGPLLEGDEIAIGGFLIRVLATGTGQGGPGRDPDGGASAALARPVHATGDDAPLEARRLLHRRLLAQIDLRRQEIRHLETDELRARLRAILAEIIAADPTVTGNADPVRLVDALIDEAVGLGPLETLLGDDTVSEIMVNGTDAVYVERAGILQRSELRFSSDDAIRSVIDRIVSPIGRRIDDGSPMVDARLPDGSRVNAIIPPLAIRGPAITIRRFNAKVFAPADLIRLRTASVPMLDFLGVCVRNRRNIVVSGGTGSGKTTLLNVLSNLIDDGERIVTIEDAAELRLRHAHLVALESRPPNTEGKGQVTIRDLVRNALRMRPDRIIVGECRGGEALDMLQAMNTGHDGSLTTVHANSPRDVVARLEVMVLMAGVDIPVLAIREQIASAVDIIIQQARQSDGVRRITEITEITGIEGGRIQMQPIFRLNHGRSASGRVEPSFEACGHVPGFYDALADAGVELDYTPFREELRS